MTTTGGNSEKKMKRLAVLQRKLEKERRDFNDVRFAKDEIRNTMGRKIKVHGRTHIIVPVLDRPIGYLASYMGYKDYGLSKII